MGVVVYTACIGKRHGEGRAIKMGPVNWNGCYNMTKAWSYSLTYILRPLGQINSFWHTDHQKSQLAFCKRTLSRCSFPLLLAAHPQFTWGQVQSTVVLPPHKRSDQPLLVGSMIENVCSQELLFDQPV